jgi:glycosyltransferase involved in cell wall biosynthesis
MSTALLQVPNPEVSIIMASYNSAGFIRQSVTSVLQQSFKSWELIISDDGSTDKTHSIISAFIAIDPRVRVITSDINRGAARARNAALAVANGRFIAFLDSDDLWKPQKLERQLAFMTQNKAPFSFSGYERIAEDGTRLDLVRPRGSVSYRQMLLRNFIGCLTAMYDTEYFGKVEMPDIAKRQDYGLWLALLKKVDVAAALPESLGYYRVRKNSVSSNKAAAAYFTWKLFRDIERLPIPVASYYFAQYALRSAWTHFGLQKHQTAS